MKYFLFPLVALLAGSALAGETKAPPANSYVAFSVALRETSARAGDTAHILLRLVPKKGIHVNLRPAIKIAFDSTGIVAGTGAPTIPAADTFLNAAKPIVQPVVLADTLRPGKAVIRGMLTYFYCSDAEGWCSWFKQPFELAVTVARRR